MSISASMVKELRERTGAGMMECKKALVETDGDMDGAVELLRKSGQAKADKKSSRVAADGRIVIVTDEFCVVARGWGVGEHAWNAACHCFDSGGREVFIDAAVGAKDEIERTIEVAHLFGTQLLVPLYRER